MYYYQKNVKKFIKLIVNFQKFPNEKIIVRPHPAEKKNLWEKSLMNNQKPIKYDGELSSYIRNVNIY